MRRVVGGGLAGLLAVLAFLAPGTPAAEVPAHAAPVTAPEVTFFHGYNQKIDDIIDELRLSVVLKVPRGYVDKDTLELKPVGGKHLRVGYDHYGGESVGTSGYIDNRYINTAGASGALRWAKNVDQYFTIHKVIPAGDNDFLVMSIEGDMNFSDNLAENNVVDGRQTTGPVFFSFESGTPGSGTAWMRGAPLTTYNVGYNIYSARTGAVSGPIVQVMWDNQYNLWSRGQANWAMVLDYDRALGDYAATNRPASVPEGVIPANSVGVHLANPAFNTVTSGPANSVTSSFWYAWVHEDGKLVEEINTAPIHVTGMTPNANVWPAGSAGGRMAKNDNTNGTRPTLAYTDDAGSQGLNSARVSRDGAIDFRDLVDRGTGYYRLLVWPETSDPATVTSAAAGKERVFAAGELFDSSGRLTQLAETEKWIAGSAYYKYTIERPEPPVIDVPAEGSQTNANDTVQISGTGEPGRSITLKFRKGAKVQDTTDPSLTTLVDGDLNCAASGGCEVIVDAAGKWSYTYTPSTPLVDADYSVVALQTEQDSLFNMTSEPSSPNDPVDPTAWGVTFTIDTVAPSAPVLTCPASPTQQVRPELRGDGVEAGATVTVHQRDLATEPPTITTHAATVIGSTWEYTPADDLRNGKYEFWVTQLDRAGNVSAASSPICEVQVSTAMPTVGEKVALEVTNPAPSITPIGAENWEITATEGATTTVISNPAQPVELDRAKTYIIGERLASMHSDGAELFAQRGDTVCVDGKGATLPQAVFDPATAELTIGPADVISEPISCTITNQSSHVSYVTQRIGGQTTAAPDGWGLSGATGSARFDLKPDGGSARALPATYELRPTVPEGISLVGVQQLDLTRVECAAQAPTPIQAPGSCWVEADREHAVVAQGAHQVFRVVAGTPADMPTLPLTGGLGSWQFVAAGCAALVVSAIGLWRRRIAIGGSTLAG